MLDYTLSELKTIVDGLAVELPLFYDSEVAPIRAILSLKDAGDMSILRGEENRERFFKQIAVRGTKIVGLKQIHSKMVHLVEDLGFQSDSKNSKNLVEGDGLVASTGEFLLTVTVADCLPIWIIDRKRLMYAIVHSGWRGTGIVIEALELLRERLGSLRENLRVVIGPGVGRCCYSVDRGRYEYFRENFGEASVEKFHGKFYLDLQAANLRLLRGYGIEDIVIIRDCTYCNTKLSSFRREGIENFGTMVAVIGRNEKFIL